MRDRSFIAGTRVQWSCGAVGCSYQTHHGTVSDMPYATAVSLGLTADPEPDRPYVAVAFDDRPGALQYHPIGEIVIAPDPEQIARDLAGLSAADDEFAYYTGMTPLQAEQASRYWNIGRRLTIAFKEKRFNFWVALSCIDGIGQLMRAFHEGTPAQFDAIASDLEWLLADAERPRV